MKRYTLMAMLALAASACEYNPMEPKTMAVTPPTANLYLGETQQFTCSAECTWPSKAPNGLYAAMRLGSDTVTACRRDDAAICASAYITVTTGVISISVSPSADTLDITETLLLDVQVQTTDNGVSRSFRSSATCGSLVGSTFFTPPPTPSVCTLTFTSLADTTKSATAIITVLKKDWILYWREDSIPSARCQNAKCEEIYRMISNGADATRITKTTWFQDLEPNWTPDGLAFVFVRSGACLPSSPAQAVLLASPAGTNLKRITPCSINAQEPSVSPDGQRIAFSYYEPPDTVRFAGIAIINLDGTGLTKRTSIPCNGGCRVDGNPHWSPDGRRLLFGRNGDLYLVSADSNDHAEPVDLTNTPNEIEFEAVYSPDGRQISFANKVNNGKAQIWVMNADGSGRRQLTFDADVDDCDPTWSPDSRRIAYSWSCSWMGDIYVRNADGSGTAVNITNTPGLAERFPAWRP